MKLKLHFSRGEKILEVKAQTEMEAMKNLHQGAVNGFIKIEGIWYNIAQCMAIELAEALGENDDNGPQKRSEEPKKEAAEETSSDNLSEGSRKPNGKSSRSSGKRNRKGVSKTS